MNNTIDTLIDSAFEKDRSHLPVQPGTPDAALLSKLGATVPVSHASVSAGSNAALSIGASKFFLGIAGFALIGALSYMFSSAPVTTDRSGNGMIFLAEDSVKPNKPSDTSHKKETQIIEKVPEKNPSIINPLDSLLMPQTPAKKYSSDSTTVPIRKPR